MNMEQFVYLMFLSHSLRSYLEQATPDGSPICFRSSTEVWDRVEDRMMSRYREAGGGERTMIAAAFWFLYEGGALPAHLRTRGFEPFGPHMIPGLDDQNRLALAAALTMRPDTSPLMESLERQIRFGPAWEDAFAERRWQPDWMPERNPSVPLYG